MFVKPRPTRCSCVTAPRDTIAAIFGSMRRALNRLVRLRNGPSACAHFTTGVLVKIAGRIDAML